MVDALTIVEVAGLVIGFPLVAYAIGAVIHIWIDQRASTRLKDSFFKTTREQIVDPLERRITARLDAIQARVATFAGADLPDYGPQLAELEAKLDEVRPDVGAELTAWLQTSDGQSWSRAIVGGVAASIRERAGSIKGNVARREQSTLYDVIRPAIDKVLVTGNPAVDVVVGLIPPEVKDQAAVRLTRVLRQVLHDNPGMLSAIQDAEFEVVDEEQPAAEPESPQLEGGQLGDGYR